MLTLKLTKKWIGPHGRMTPGDYPIPDKISRKHAQCAVLDGAGYVRTEVKEKKAEEPAAPKTRGRSPGRRKAAAPENKQLASAPENKSEVEGAAGDSGGNGAEPCAGSGSALQNEPPADDSGQ